jgi:DNA-binding NarL/FixJ family response regulator
MPEADGLSVLRDMGRERAATRTIVLTAAEDEQVHEAIRLGAHGVVLKSMAPGLLVRCIREVHAGRRWLERNSATQTLELMLRREAGMRSVRHALTPRELEIATMVGNGMRNKAVASRMSITEGTAKLHLHHVYRKLNVDGRIGLIRYLQRKGLA